MRSLVRSYAARKGSSLTVGRSCFYPKERLTLEPAETRFSCQMCSPYESIWIMKKQRLAPTTIRLDEQDKQIIATIKEHYGVKSDNDAIRLALRDTLREIKRQSQPHQPQTSNGQPVRW